MPAKVDPDNCVGCGACISACPQETIAMDGDVAKVNPDGCVECGACVDACPQGAITMV